MYSVIERKWAAQWSVFLTTVFAFSVALAMRDQGVAAISPGASSAPPHIAAGSLCRFWSAGRYPPSESEISHQVPSWVHLPVRLADITDRASSTERMPGS